MSVQEQEKIQKSYDEMLKKAVHLSYEAHRDQTDKSGQLYFLHPVFVALNVETIEQKITALLHDVVEDTDITLADLKNAGFSDEIVEAVGVMTKTDESYDEYIKKVKTNTIAKAVKIADLRHNSDLTRLKEVTERDLKRVEKYKKALEYLSGEEE